MKRIRESLKYRFNSIELNLYSQLPIDENEINKAIIIAANPRGGSTWLSDIFSGIPDSTSYYEPLNLGYMHQAKAVGFASRTIIPENVTNPDAHNYFLKLFSGKLNNYRMTFHPMAKNQSIIDIVSAKTRIFKFCRATLLIPWLVKNFATIRKPIVISRHPCATIASQLKFGKVMGGAWNKANNTSFFSYFNQANSECFEPYTEYVNALDSFEGILAATWCLSNKYTLDHSLNNKNWITISYEDLLLNPTNSIGKVASRLNLNKYKSILVHETAINKQSGTTISKQKIDPGAQLIEWKKTLNSKQIDSILKVVDYFDMTKFYDDSLEPNRKALYNE